MPLDSIKKWFFQNELKKQVAYGFEKSNAIGVYLGYSKDLEEVNQVKKLIQQQGVKQEDIYFILFANQKEPIFSENAIYSLKEIKWAGFPQNEGITKFISRTYKRFYYLCPTLEPHQFFILSKIKAEFKAGVYSKGIESILDLTIDNQFHSPLESLKEINSTITKLTTKHNGEK